MMSMYLSNPMYIAMPIGILKVISTLTINQNVDNCIPKQPVPTIPALSVTKKKPLTNYLFLYYHTQNLFTNWNNKMKCSRFDDKPVLEVTKCHQIFVEGETFSQELCRRKKQPKDGGRFQKVPAKKGIESYSPVSNFYLLVCTSL